MITITRTQFLNLIGAEPFGAYYRVLTTDRARLVNTLETLGIKVFHVSKSAIYIECEETHEQLQ